MGLRVLNHAHLDGTIILGWLGFLSRCLLSPIRLGVVSHVQPNEDSFGMRNWLARGLTNSMRNGTRTPRRPLVRHAAETRTPRRRRDRHRRVNIYQVSRDSTYDPRAWCIYI